MAQENAALEQLFNKAGWSSSSSFFIIGYCFLLVGGYYCSQVQVCHREGEEWGGYLKTGCCSKYLKLLFVINGWHGTQFLWAGHWSAPYHFSHSYTWYFLFRLSNIFTLLNSYLLHHVERENKIILVLDSGGYVLLFFFSNSCSSVPIKRAIRAQLCSW